MGWSFYHASHYKKDGYTVDRKAECDGLINDDNNVVIKSQMVGSVYYAAVRTVREVVRDENGCAVTDEKGNYVRRDVDLLDQKVWAAVFKTGKEDDFYNFGYNDMDETCGPCECDCPRSILELLTPTDSKFANEWRERCYKSLEAKKMQKSFNCLPYGSKIRFTDWEGKVHILTKHEPCYQFNSWFWYDEERNGFIRKNLITPENAEFIIEEALV